MYDNKQLQEISTQVRRDILRMVCSAKSGHPGGSMSSTDILTTLYFNVMKQDPATWTRDGKGQDMFILSAGHMTPVYYSVLARAGYFPVSELATFRTFGARLQGHPSIRKGLPGIFQASARASPPRAASPSARSWTRTTTSSSACAVTANPRKARSGKPACSPCSTSWTTSSR